MSVRILDERTLRDIENVLKIKFHGWQMNYLLKKPEILNLRTTGRCTGKTLTYIIELLFKEDLILDLSSYDMAAKYCDWWSIERDPRGIIGCGYSNHFLHEIRRIYNSLNAAGIQTRTIIFKREGITGRVNHSNFMDEHKYPHVVRQVENESNILMKPKLH